MRQAPACAARVAGTTHVTASGWPATWLPRGFRDVAEPLQQQQTPWARSVHPQTAGSAAEQAHQAAGHQGAQLHTSTLPLAQDQARNAAASIYIARRLRLSGGCGPPLPGCSSGGSAGLGTAQTLRPGGSNCTFLGVARGLSTGHALRCGRSYSFSTARRYAHNATVSAGRAVSGVSSSPGAGGQRCFGSSQGGAPPLKTQLRELYKRVHPDQFQDHPEAQASGHL